MELQPKSVKSGYEFLKVMVSIFTGMASFISAIYG